MTAFIRVGAVKRIMKMFSLQLADRHSSKYFYLHQQRSDLKHHTVKSTIGMLALHNPVRCRFLSRVRR